MLYNVRCNESIALNDAQYSMGHGMRRGPLKLHEIIDLFGRALIPSLQETFFKHRGTVASLEKMYEVIRVKWEAMQLQRTWARDTTPDVDPHAAPLLASSITGKPTTQVERKFHEQTRMWNPSNQVLPLGLYGMPSQHQQAPHVNPEPDTKLLKELAEQRKALKEVLALIQNQEVKPKGKSDEHEENALLNVARVEHHAPASSPIPSGYDPCSLPVSWGCDPMHVSL